MEILYVILTVKQKENVSEVSGCWSVKRYFHCLVCFICVSKKKKGKLDLNSDVYIQITHPDLLNLFYVQRKRTSHTHN